MRNRSRDELPAVLLQLHEEYQEVQRKPYLLDIYEISYLHFHAEFELGLCVSGSGICHMEDDRQTYRAGDVQIIFPYMRHLHQSDAERSTSWYWITVDPNELLEHIGVTDTASLTRHLQEEIAVSGIVNAENFPKTSDALHQFFDCFLTQDARSDVFQEMLALRFYEVLLCVFEESKAKAKIPYKRRTRVQAIAPALEEIKENLQTGTPIRIEALAAKCKYSVAHFRRMFHASLDCSPQEYIVACKIQMAKKLLKKSKKSILEIAQAVGYDNISGFNRAFLQYTKMPPSQYRKNQI